MLVLKKKLPPWRIICINKNAWLVSGHLKNYHKMDLSPQPAPTRDGMLPAPLNLPLCAPQYCSLFLLQGPHHDFWPHQLVLPVFAFYTDGICRMSSSGAAPSLHIMLPGFIPVGPSRRSSLLFVHPHYHDVLSGSVLPSLSLLLMDVWLVHPDSCWTPANMSVLCPGDTACTSFG